MKTSSFSIILTGYVTDSGRYRVVIEERRDCSGPPTVARLGCSAAAMRTRAAPDPLSAMSRGFRRACSEGELVGVDTERNPIADYDDVSTEMGKKEKRLICMYRAFSASAVNRNLLNYLRLF